MLLFAPTARGEDRVTEFLHALQQNGYEDVAVDYLKLLAEQGKMPPELGEVQDLELSNSLRGAAAHAFDAADYEQLMADAEKHLNKFLKDKPDHPEAVAAMVSWGNLSKDRAVKQIGVARGLADKQQQGKLLGEARAALKLAGTRFAEAAEKFQARLADLPEPPKRATKKAEREAELKREQLENDWLSARFQAAQVDYYTAQTYLDPADETRKKSLKAAAAAFDAIYQTNRLNIAGIYAHMWHGKATEELGDLQTALDIYEEVLANAPDPGQAPTKSGLEPLFAQVEFFRLLILAKQHPQQFLGEAAVWLQLYARSLRRTDGYQGVALELAKAKLALAKGENVSAAEKGKNLKEALDLLLEMSRVPSQHQQEAILLRRQNAKAGAAAEPTTFDEAVALGNAAADASQWEDAAANYARALEFAEKVKVKDTKRPAEVRNALAETRYRIARDQFNANKLEECLATTGKIVSEFKDSPAAPAASSLAVSAALNLYVVAPADKKKKTLERLESAAQFTRDTWPDKPEADDARMALGQAQLVTGQIEAGLKVFDAVNPKSERYPSALQLAGRTHWQRYLMEKSKAEGQQNKDQMAADRGKALEKLTASLDTQRKKAEAGKPMPRGLMETQLVLGEILFEGNQVKEAAALYQPLVDAIKAQKPESMDNTVLRIFVGAVRCYGALSDLDKAGEVSGVLIDMGPDLAAVNGVLVEFAKLLNLERKKADAAKTAAEAAGDAKALEAATAKVTSTQDLLGKVLKKMSARKELSPAAMVFVADTCATIGLTAEARDLYQRILERAKTDAEFAKTVTRVRSQLVGLLGNEGQYEEAVKQVKQLVADNPKALEPMMVEGRILQAWAEKDPAHYDEAVAHWSMLRNKLQASKKKPPDYYEVTYNVAECLYRQAWSKRLEDAAAAGQKAKQAAQLLKAALVLSPALTGPDMVARYNKLLQDATKLMQESPGAQGAQPAAGGKK